MILAILILSVLANCLLVFAVLAIGSTQRGMITFFRRVDGFIDEQRFQGRAK